MTTNVETAISLRLDQFTFLSSPSAAIRKSADRRLVQQPVDDRRQTHEDHRRHHRRRSTGSRPRPPASGRAGSTRTATMMATEKPLPSLVYLPCPGLYILRKHSRSCLTGTSTRRWHGTIANITPGGNRTPNLWFWRPMLYQVELLAYCRDFPPESRNSSIVICVGSCAPCACAPSCRYFFSSSFGAPSATLISVR